MTPATQEWLLPSYRWFGSLIDKHNYRIPVQMFQFGRRPESRIGRTDKAWICHLGLLCSVNLITTNLGPFYDFLSFGNGKW
jgi:hypothetical protein